MVLSGPLPVEAVCGDGFLDRGEACDDGNLASGDCCEPDCTLQGDGSPCEPADPCLQGGICDSGVCTGPTPVDCDDADPCTVEYCEGASGGCVYEVVDGCCTSDAQCDDNVVCNGFETCSLGGGGAGTCVSGAPIACDDGDPCTLDECGRRGCTAIADEELPGCLASDDDGDGVWDRIDRCPDSVAGALPVADGCSALDFARHPEILIETADRELALLPVRWMAPESLKRERRNVGKLRKAMAVAALDLSSGRSCKATRRFSKAERLAEGILRGLRVAIDREESLARTEVLSARGVPQGESDHRPEDFSVGYFQLVATKLAEPIELATHASEFAAAICSNSQKYSTSATVALVGSDHSSVETEDGRVVYTGGARVKGSIQPGAEIIIKGESFGSLEAVSAKIKSTIKTPAPLLPVDASACLKLRIAPAQPAEDLEGSPVVLPLEGYRFEGADESGTLWLEHEMALYMEGLGCPGSEPAPDGTFYRYFVGLEMETKTTIGGKKKVASAHDIGPDEYWKFPSDVSGPGTLTVTWYRRVCGLATGPACSWATTEKLLTREFPISVFGYGEYCRVEYDQTEFALEDLPRYYDGWSAPWVPTATYNTFAEARAVGTSGLNILMGGSASFQAWAYEVTGGSSSTYPALDLISENVPFAIYPTRDPVWNETGWQGVDRPAGVAWPHVVGVRNNELYRFACSVPTVVRDLVDFCPFPNSYYRLPYFGTAQCGQGNNTLFTHCGGNYPIECGQKYAFDFSVAPNYPVAAARGGLVLAAFDSAQNSCSSKTVCSAEDYHCCIESPGGGICRRGDPAKINDICHSDEECDTSRADGDGRCWCAANSIAIEHSDGTVGEYLHMVKGGVNVEPGDRVYRSDNIGATGSTGCSTDPHIHFHTVGTVGEGTQWEKATRPVAFETTLGPCVVPISDSISTSTQRDWYSNP